MGTGNPHRPPDQDLDLIAYQLDAPMVAHVLPATVWNLRIASQETVPLSLVKL
jgi:hypothetical protein